MVLCYYIQNRMTTLIGYKEKQDRFSFEAASGSAGP